MGQGKHTQSAPANLLVNKISWLVAPGGQAGAIGEEHYQCLEFRDDSVIHCHRARVVPATEPKDIATGSNQYCPYNSEVH